METATTFMWIVDRPPTEEDADSFGNVAVARWNSCYAQQNWEQCANGFIRPWQTIKACEQASVDDRAAGYPKELSWAGLLEDGVVTPESQDDSIFYRIQDKIQDRWHNNYSQGIHRKLDDAVAKMKSHEDWLGMDDLQATRVVRVEERIVPTSFIIEIPES